VPLFTSGGLGLDLKNLVLFTSLAFSIIEMQLNINVTSFIRCCINSLQLVTTQRHQLTDACILWLSSVLILRHVKLQATSGELKKETIRFTAPLRHYPLVGLRLIFLHSLNIVLHVSY